MSQSLGKNIRQMRKQKKRTLKEIAEMTGVSISFLSQLELNKTKATLETLRKISIALDVHPSAFFSNVEQTLSYPFYYQDLSQSLHLAAFKPMKVILKPSENLGNEITHVGHEFIYVLKGQLIVTLQGQQLQLNAGHSYMFDAAIEHYWKNETMEDVEFLVVTTN